MTNNLKLFIENHIDFIEDNKFDDLYENCYAKLRGELTAVLYTINIDPLVHMTTLYTNMFKGVIADTRFVIPDNILVIEPYVFAHCTTIKSIMVPHGFTYLPEACFAYCTNLRVVSLPDTIKNLGSCCFAYTDLDHIEYRGTVAQFEKTKLNSKTRWKEYSSLMHRSGKIHCEDGVI